jgi:hypothetical protein
MAVCKNRNIGRFEAAMLLSLGGSLLDEAWVLIFQCGVFFS